MHPLKTERLIDEEFNMNTKGINVIDDQNLLTQQNHPLDRIWISKPLFPIDLVQYVA